MSAYLEMSRVHEDVFPRLPEIARVDLGFPNDLGIHGPRFTQTPQNESKS